MKTTYTPGPWKFYDNLDRDDSYRIMSVGRGSDANDVAKVRLPEDARLIAAAPELLELARILVSFTVNAIDPKDFTNIREQAQRAIAKATGGAKD